MSGAATHYVPSSALPLLRKRLSELSSSNTRTIADAINEFSTTSRDFSLNAHRPAIDRCFGQRSVEDIVKALEKEKTTWADEALSMMRKASPTSLKVTFEQVRRGRTMGFEECFVMERRLGCRMMVREWSWRGERGGEEEEEKGRGEYDVYEYMSMYGV